MNAKKAKQLRRAAREAAGPDAFQNGYDQDERRSNYVVAIDTRRGIYRAMKEAARKLAKK